MSLVLLYIARSNNSLGADCQKILVHGKGSAIAVILLIFESAIVLAFESAILVDQTLKLRLRFSFEI